MQLSLGLTVHGFTVNRITPVPEQALTLYEMEHEQSGAKLIYAEKEDPNKVFGVAFKTIPTDSTGVFHILEHCMLNGSEKYPLKEPFVNLLKTSMQTFLNAMTFPDKTVYPVASQNEKDFTNLMSVYLDAVFAPNLRKNREVFLQEGWHYEVLSPDAPLIYKGVVYNEMKGAMSSVNDVIEEANMAALFTDTCYRHNSGGDPEVIPTLTYEQFLASYRKYYHADNAILYLYGAMELEEKLAFLDEAYLSKFKREEGAIEVEFQPPVVNDSYTAEYEIGENDSLEQNTYITRAYCVGDYTDPERILALSVLNEALMSANESPLKKALLEASLGQDVKGQLVDGILQPYYVFELDKTEAEQKEKFLSVLETELRRLSEEGIDREVLEASLNRMEFKLREMDYGSFPRGLVNYFDILSSALYGGKPEAFLCYESAIAHMREGLANGYFEALIKDCFLTGKHHATVVVTPSKTLAEERLKRASEKAEGYKASLSQEELAALIEENKTLIAHQSEEDTPEQIATLPRLSLSDLGDAPEEAGTEVKDGVLFHETDTNGIVYLNYYFDLSSVAEEDLPYVTMLGSVYGKLGTKRTPAQKIVNEIKLNFGDLKFSTTIVPHGSEECTAALTVSCSVLKQNVAKALSLLSEILNETEFTAEGVSRILTQNAAQSKIMVVQAGHQYAIGMLSSYLTAAGVYKEALSGVAFCRKLNRTAESFDADCVLGKFSALSDAILRKGDCVVSVTGDRSCLAAYEENAAAFAVNAVPTLRYATATPEGKNEGIAIPADINYVAKGFNYAAAGETYCGVYEVLSQILQYDYLWNEVRVKGGAYGTGFIADKSTIAFWSYRDPNVANTLAAFDGAEEYLNGFAADEDAVTGYIIGTIAARERPRSPRMDGNAADLRYFAGITPEERALARRQMIGTTAEDIRACAKLIREMKEKCAVSVVGNKKTIEASGAVRTVTDL